MEKDTQASEKPFYLTQTANEIIVTQNSNQKLNHIGLYSVTGSLIKVIKKIV